jgi:hypothetical protein
MQDDKYTSDFLMAIQYSRIVAVVLFGIITKGYDKEHLRALWPQLSEACAEGPESRDLWSRLKGSIQSLKEISPCESACRKRSRITNTAWA